jgi:hypothetical protein
VDGKEELEDMSTCHLTGTHKEKSGSQETHIVDDEVEVLYKAVSTC